MVPERVIERLWERVSSDADSCWIWPLSVGSHGYGQIGWWEGGHSVMVLTHRAAWEATHGRIPPGMTVDHLCRVRRCCNPAHLRLLTNRENASDNVSANRLRARTHCPSGHPYAGSNLLLTKQGHRKCRACANRRRGAGGRR